MGFYPFTGSGGPADWLNVVTQYGADPSGVRDSTVAFQAAVNAIQAAGTKGGTIYYPAGTYLLASTVTQNAGSCPIYHRGAGDFATYINYTGTGDAFRIYDPSTYTTRTKYGGGFLGITIDGTSAGAGSSALHLGDLFRYQLEMTCRNFTGAGSKGVWLDNQYFWTEQLRGQVYAEKCASHVVFDTNPAGQTTATGSFERCELGIWIAQSTPSFDGVVLQNGAFIMGGKLGIKGNFLGSSSALTSAVLRLTGSSPAGHPSTNAGILYSEIQIDVECATGSAFTPQTIVYGAPGTTNYILSSIGYLNFGQGSQIFTSSNINSPQSPGALSFIGAISGDALLSAANSRYGVNISGPLTYGTGFAAASGAVSANGGDFYAFTLTANATINLAGGTGFTVGGPQRLTLRITQAGAGGFTVTWPKPGSPTEALPAVYWAGGTAPTMTAAANAIDVYDLETFDGIRWYGRALQNVS